MNSTFPIAVVGVAIVFLLPAELPAAVPDFNRDIHPIFESKCFSCHGPRKQKGGLRLDNKTAAMQGGDSGPVIIPGKASGSKLIQLVSGEDPDKIMPAKGERLSSTQIAMIRQWIDAGAVWPESTDTSGAKSDHWAFQQPVRSELPRVTDRSWPRNAIDHFVLARLDSENIKPSPRANRYTLIRRLSLDLIGLPPSLEEVEHFVNDKSPKAYENLTDRLLASEHFGERWGRHWLDLARYADSDGYEKDRGRPYAYLYRDWVIQAVNDDIPFDQFSTEQLAGDLIPKATHKQKVATGFHRQTLTNTEGGTDQEEFRCKAIVDRVSTTATVWLGVTLGCAECHSHKYDPLTQREFYQFFAFFNNASEKNLPSPQKAELDRYNVAKEKWDVALKQLKDDLANYEKTVQPKKFAAWADKASAPATEWQPLKPEKLTSTKGPTLKGDKDSVVIASGKNPGTDTYIFESTTSLRELRGVRLEAIDDPDPKKGPGRSTDGNFVLTRIALEIVTPDGKRQAVTLLKPKADFSQKSFAVAASLEGKTTSGWAVSPKKNENHVAVYETKGAATVPPGAKLEFRLEHNYRETYLLQRFRLSVTDSPTPYNPTLLGDGLARALAKASDARSDADRKTLLGYFRDNLDADRKKLADKIVAHDKKKPAYPPTFAAAIVEEPKGRQTHIHLRGNFLDKGAEVSPNTPAVLHPMSKTDSKSSRLDLAKWLFDPRNPLTSRVTVNHIWKNLFGRGLVASVDDFGTRGEKPSHPDLLDWLATEFPRLGWSRKQLIKLIVMSNTYQQSSRIRSDLTGRDPLNTLLARQSRLRLEAEIIRDSYLTTSGLLSRKIGGPSIRPALPQDIAALGYANSVKWNESKGEDKYRRGMYIFFQRTVPYPMLMTFDAPDSTSTCTRRERSNTPLQALTLLNDPVFFECAQALGQRMVSLTDGTIAAKLSAGFQWCFSRQPGEEELSALMDIYQRQDRLTRKDLESARRIISKKDESPSTAETATLIALARVMLNLDEFITRE